MILMISCIFDNHHMKFRICDNSPVNKRGDRSHMRCAHNNKIHGYTLFKDIVSHESVSYLIVNSLIDVVYARSNGFN